MPTSLLPRLLALAWALVLAWTLVVPAVAPAASGFEAETQDAQASALGGAFTGLVGPASVFYNPGAAAKIEKPTYALGNHSRVPDYTFEAGANDLGVRLVYDQSTSAQHLQQIFAVLPLRKRANLGIAVTRPFDLDVVWQSPDTFAARSLVTSGQIRAVDVSTVLALRLSKTFGIGFGAIYRSTNLTIDRRIQTTVSSVLTDFGSLSTSSGEEPGFGWTVGVHHEPTKTFAWGLTYRSPITIDVGATATLTQISTGDATLDAALALANPFGESLGASTPLDYPETANLGVRLGDPALFLLAVDLRWTGWSRFGGLVIDVPDFPDYDITYASGYQDTFGASVGAQYTLPGGTALRFGLGWDQSAQIDSVVDPLFFDGDRWSLGAGFGRDWLEVALAWTSLTSRSGTFALPDDADGLSGTFTGQSLSLTVTLKKLPSKKDLGKLAPAAPSFSLEKP